MTISKSSLKFAVIGSPITHSLSPTIHKLFAQQFNIALQYTALNVTTAQLPDALLALCRQGYRGLNVTAPLKEQILPFVSKLTTTAKQSAAVNTITFDHYNNALIGDNTDGVGFSKDLMINNKIELKDKKILIFGAGGACRGIVSTIVQHQPKSIIIANRSYQPALAIAEQFDNFPIIVGYHELPLQVDLLINATNVDFAETCFTEQLRTTNGKSLGLQHTICYDLNYAQKRFTPFSHWASNQRAPRIINGLGMLVEQAAFSFFQWHKVRPDTLAVLAYLNNMYH